MQDPLARGWDPRSVGWLQPVGSLSLSGSKAWEGGLYPLSPVWSWFGALEEGGVLTLPSVSQGWLWNKEICGPASGAEPSSFDVSG